MKKEAVLMVHNYYQIGGGEHTVFENEAAMLREHGHKVVTYTRSNNELKEAKWKLLTVPFSTIWSWKTYREVRTLIKKENIEVVHCHNTFPLISPSVYYAALSLGVPVVQTIHNFRFLCPNGVFYRDGHICEDCRECNSFIPALKHRCYRNSITQTMPVVAMLTLHRALGTYKKPAYIFLTEFNRSKFNKLVDIHSERVFIKPHFVKTSETHPVNPNFHKNTFVFAGRLEENKGLVFLINAWKNFPKEYELHIYGDGEFRAEVIAAAAQCNNIKYFGFVSQELILQDLSSSIALIFPSKLYETFGMTIAESFSQGVPVIAADIGNHADLVKSSGGGVVFQVEDAASLWGAIDDVLRNNERYSRHASVYYNRYLAEEENYLRLIQIYSISTQHTHLHKM